MARHPKYPPNPVKARAQKRAAELGTTLTAVYKKAKVTKGYLDYEPKEGHSPAKIRAIAIALNWTPEQLLYGPESDDLMPPIETPDDERLFDLSYGLAQAIVEGAGPPPELRDDLAKRASRIIYFGLRACSSLGLPESAETARVWGTLLVKELMAA